MLYWRVVLAFGFRLMSVVCIYDLDSAATLLIFAFQLLLPVT